jgi:hypothetical protein
MAPADRDASACERVIDVDVRREFVCTTLENREMARAGHGAMANVAGREPHT